MSVTLAFFSVIGGLSLPDEFPFLSCAGAVNEFTSEIERSKNREKMRSFIEVSRSEPPASSAGVVFSRLSFLKRHYRSLSRRVGILTIDERPLVSHVRFNREAGRPSRTERTCRPLRCRARLDRRLNT